MSALSEIRPRKHQRLIDLVRAADVDVSDWANFKRGARWAAANPKYCYEWSFVEHGKVIVLCLWHASMHVEDGAIVQTLNMREIARRFEELTGGALGKRRSRGMDLAIQRAFREGLPIRVVVCEGHRRDLDEPEAKPSRVHRRLLDPVTWAVTSYDWSTGQCTLVRGVLPDRFADQFSIQSGAAALAKRRAISGQAYVRSAEVRRRVRERAQGKCEWCGELGFTLPDGRVYIETHHVVALAEDGFDTQDNVVALCPNHHQEAHHGVNKRMMREALLDRLARMIDAEPGAAHGRRGSAERRLGEGWKSVGD